MDSVYAHEDNSNQSCDQVFSAEKSERGKNLGTEIPAAVYGLNHHLNRKYFRMYSRGNESVPKISYQFIFSRASCLKLRVYFSHSSFYDWPFPPKEK
jgi:hypothetical protein